MTPTPIKYYFRNTSVDGCGDYDLSKSTGTVSYLSLLTHVDWSETVNKSLTIPKGTYNVRVKWTLSGGTGSGSIKVRVMHKNDACVTQNLLTDYVLGTVHSVNGTYEDDFEFVLTNSVDFASGDCIFVQVVKSTGGVTKAYQGTYNDASSYLDMPYDFHLSGDLSSDDPVNTLLPPVGPWFSPLVPIANWFVPGHQRLANGGTLDIGVGAFCKREDTHVQDGGIDKIRYTVTPSEGTYDGNTAKVIDVTTITQNANIVNVHNGVKTAAYWTQIDAMKFSATNPIFTVSAKAYSNSTNAFRDADTGGGGQGLEVLTSYADTNGSRAQRWAYVDKVDGNDGTAVTFASDQGGLGSVANADRWGTIHAALVRLGTDGMDGAMVCLRSAQQHVFNDPDGTFSDANGEWVTIKPWNGDLTDTRINGLPPNYGVSKVKQLRFRDIWFGTTDNTLKWQTQAGNEAWFDHCLLESPNQFAALINTSRIIAVYPSAFYSTETEVKTARTGLRGGSVLGRTKLHRGCYYHHIGLDCMGGRIGAAINLEIDNIVPVDDKQHTDVCQYGDEGTTPLTNVIFQDWQCTNIASIGAMYDVGATNNPVSGLAFVNMYWDRMIHPPTGLGGFVLGRPSCAEHVLLWYLALRNQDEVYWDPEPENPETDNLFNPKQRIMLGRSVNSDSHLGGLSVIGCQCGYMLLGKRADRPTDAKFDCTYNDSVVQATADLLHNNFFLEAIEANAYDQGCANGGTYTQTHGHDCSESAPEFNQGTGVPKASSPLARRIAMSLFPFDAGGNLRSNPTAIGAYEADPATLLTVERHRPRGRLRGTLRGV